MATSVGTLWVDVRFNTGNIARDLGTNLRGVSNQIGSELGGAGAAAGEQISAGLSQKLTTLGTSMGNLGRQVSLGLSLPLIAFGAAATSSFTEFDTAMTQVIGLSGVAADTVEGWRGEVIDLGKAYGVSASEAAEGLYFITSSGIDAADAMEVLNIAVKGSAIGLGSVKTNADVITSALNQYGEENLTAAQAADVLTAAVRTGKGEADAMSGALATVIPLAGAMGVSFGEVAGVMSAMTLSGTSADQAATQINALFTSLQKMPAANQRNMKALTGLDYATVQADLKTKGLTETLREIYNAFGDNEDAIAKVFGNVRALRGITNLFGEKEAQTMDVVNQTTHAYGAQEQAVKALENSEAYRLKQSQANLSAAMTKIGAAVTPIAAFGTSVFAGLLNTFDLIPGPAKTVATSLAAVAAASGPLLYMGSSVMRLAGNVGTLIGKTGGLKVFDGVLLKMMYSSNSLASGFANAITGATSLGASMRFLGVSVLAVAAAYVLLNNKLHENDAAFAALAEKGKQNQAGKSYDELGAQIESVNAQIESMNQQKADILAGGIGKGVLFGARELHDLDEAQKALYAVGESAAKTRGQAEVLAERFGISTAAAVMWLNTQKSANKLYDDGEAAAKGYAEGVKEGTQATKDAQTATEIGKNSLGGIIAASKETSDAFFAVINAQKQYRAAQEAITAAQKKVTDAQRAHTDAVKGIADASRKVVEADRKVIDSAQKVTDARQAAADAQKALNDALAGPSEDERLDVRSAKLAVREAQKGMRGASDPLEHERAQISLRRAQLDLIEVQGAHEKRVADARKDLKSATDGVTDAEQARLDAIAAAADARTALQDARDKEHQTLLDITTAQNDVTQAVSDALVPAMNLTQAQSDLATMFATGTDKAKEFRDYLDILKGQYPELIKPIDDYLNKFHELQGLPEAQPNTPPPPPPAPPPPPPPPTPYRATPKPSGEGKYIPGVGYVKGSRATGGPVAGGSLYEVNERNTPELFNVGKRQFLLPVDSGSITPHTDTGGGTSVNVGDIIVHGADQPVQTAYEIRRQLRARTRAGARL